MQAPGPVFLGHSPSARRVHAQIHRALRGREPTLIAGASGTGKHLVASILHHFGGGETSELEQVPVVAGRVGRVGDFAYLGAVEELAPSEQARLASLTGPGRLIVGTRLDPESDEGRDRLHPKLLQSCQHRIDLPMLADRVEDLEALCLATLQRTPARRPLAGLSDAALDCLRGYVWPGNVRELEQAITHAIANGTSELIELADLPGYLRLRSNTPRNDSPERRLCLEEAEKDAIRKALDYTRGNKRKAARLLHIGKTTLYRKIKTYELV
ncbi:helix-turn-helix domain-containing protein [Nannocystaceae bacterium ST9]